MKLLPIIFLFVAIQRLQSADGIKPSAEMGESLYAQPGANSCIFCHGEDGTGGRVANVGNLAKPKTWKAWKAIGGDAAYATNRIGFLAHLKDATVNLIEEGSIKHRADFNPPWFHWDKIEIYNSQMIGLGGTPSQAWLKNFEDRGVTPHMAAESLWLHLKSWDTKGILADSKLANSAKKP